MKFWNEPHRSAHDIAMLLIVAPFERARSSFQN
jgi:hypothetical protein